MDMVLTIHEWQRNYSALIFQERRYIKNELLVRENLNKIVLFVTDKKHTSFW